MTATAAVWDEMHTGSHALEYATIVKLTRTLAIIPITLCLGLYETHKAHKAQTGETVPLNINKILPQFILFFIVASLITTAVAYLGVAQSVFSPIKELSKFMIVMAMMAIGLNTNIVKLLKDGSKILILGCCCWVAISIVSLYIQRLMGLW